MSRALYEQDVARRILALREDLVRHDENLAAYHLLTQAVPYFLADHPAIVKAREDQRQMVLHAFDDDAYRAYYGDNPHERPFEEQYPGLTPENAHEHLYRVHFLRQGLQSQLERAGTGPGALRVLDLAANDGWMAANLALEGYRCDCVDLNRGAVERARLRARSAPGMGSVTEALIDDVPKCLGRRRHGYAAVVAFEVVEHVFSPHELLHVMTEMCAPGGRLYVSTPDGAVEQGNLPNWAHVEPKGHLRSFSKRQFGELCGLYGDVERFDCGPDGVLCAEVAPR